jgi:hypothetical protein
MSRNVIYSGNPSPNFEEAESEAIMPAWHWLKLLEETPPRGVCIWQWKAKSLKWIRIRKYCARGCDCDLPPRRRGKYDCEIVLRSCIEKKKKKKAK